MTHKHFQLYQNPRAGSMGGQMVNVLGVYIEDRGSVPSIFYLITGGKGIKDGSKPRMVVAGLVDIAVVAG